MTPTDATASEDTSVPRALSVLAPIVLGVHLSEAPCDLIDYAVQVAAMSIPTTLTDRKVLFKGDRKATTVAHHRRLLHGRLQNEGYFMRLCDCRPKGNREEWMNQSQWQLTATVLGDPSLVSGIAADAMVILLRVTSFRLNRRTIQSTRQLALTRYCLVEAFRALDPDLTISSTGQTDWHPTWWPDPVTAGAQL
jgi:hypothetical protein